MGQSTKPQSIHITLLLIALVIQWVTPCFYPLPSLLAQSWGFVDLEDFGSSDDCDSAEDDCEVLGIDKAPRMSESLKRLVGTRCELREATKPKITHCFLLHSSRIVLNDDLVHSLCRLVC